VTTDGPAQDPLSLFARAADALAGTTDVDDGVEQLMGLIADRLGADVAIVYLQDPDRTELTLGIALGLDEEERAVLEQGLGQVDDPVALTSLDRAARDFAGIGPSGGLAAAGLAAAALRPLVVARRGIELPVGVLVVGWRSSRTLSEEEQVLLGAVSDLTAVAIDRARLASMILERSEWFERLAHTDPLTGLANERTFARILELELARAGRQGSEISLAVFDVDGLGAINDRLGHATGDDVLRSVASVLAESVRLVDTVARQGGDEFVVVAPGAAGQTVAERVLSGVAALPRVGELAVSVSAGVARFPADGTSAEELLAAAQAALAKARVAGPGRIGSTEVESRG
jgi:diguanylate cyclase (GGDEF)-like protein